MPSIAPFRGVGYAMDRFGPDVTDLVCPPYDVIGPEQQRVLLARDVRNAVRLELSAEPDPHAAAAHTLRAWLADGTLELSERATLFAYAHGTPSTPDEAMVQGILARVQLEPWGSGVTPHEDTLPGPRADRLALLRATRTQLSPILALYFDRSADGGRPLVDWREARRARDDDGLLHRLATLDPDARLIENLASQRLYVADGHHRYETALAYQAEVRADPRFAHAAGGSLAADWVMAVLVNAEREELVILPTHRLLLDADSEALRALASDPGPLFAAEPVQTARLAAALAEHADDEAPAFGLALGGGTACLLVGRPDAIRTRMRREPGSAALHGVDLAVLHAAVLDDRLGIDARAVAAGERLAYTRDAAEALDRVAGGTAAAAILVRPTRLEQLAAVAAAGDVMPQKSTYFYPKLLTGMVFNPVED